MSRVVLYALLLAILGAASVSCWSTNQEKRDGLLSTRPASIKDAAVKTSFRRTLLQSRDLKQRTSPPPKKPPPKSPPPKKPPPPKSPPPKSPPPKKPPPPVSSKAPGNPIIGSEDVGDTYVDVSWDDGSAGVPEETYTLKCVAKGAPCTAAALGTPVTGIPRGDGFVTVNGLNPVTKYTCYVIAVNSKAPAGVCSDALDIETEMAYDPMA